MTSTDVHPHVAFRESRRLDLGESEPPPQLAEGIELIGEYEESGFKKAPWIVRRSDGSVIQLTELLYKVAEAADGRREPEAIAAHLREETGRSVTAGNVRKLVVERLRPLGVLAEADGSSPEMVKADQMLALKLKTSVIPESVVERICAVFKPLFLPPVVVGVLAVLIAFDLWLFFVHGIGEGLRDTLYNPATMFVLLGLVIVGTAFHECGHAAGCAYGGAKPGVMGAGMYFVWPAFYTDVTDSYRLSKRGRLRVDLGGVYFNFVFILVLAGVYGLTGYEPLLLVVLVQHFAVIQQLLPFLRLDGYYVLSDLTGVPDLFTRMKPILTDLVPGKDGGEKVRALKPWVRVVTTLWVGILIPVILFNILFMVTQLPRIYATAYDSFLLQFDALESALSDGDVLKVLASLVQTLALLLPAAGVTYTFIRVGRRIVAGSWSLTEGRPVARTSLVGAGLALAAVSVWTLYPSGEYRPLQEGERLNVATVSRSVAAIPTGRPALTEERQADLGGAPTQRQQRQVSEDDAPDREATDEEEPIVPATTTTLGDEPEPDVSDSSTTTDATTTDETTTTSSTTMTSTSTTTSTTSTTSP